MLPEDSQPFQGPMPQTTPNTAAPTEPTPVPGLNSQGLTPTQARAFPEIPPEYTPGVDAPVKHAYEDSLLYKISSVFASYGESIPSQLKVKLAQQQVDMNKQKQQMAMSNFYTNNEVTKSALAAHNRDAINQAMELLPNYKARLATVRPGSDEHSLILNNQADVLESLMPGGGKVMRHIAQNLPNVFAMDVFLRDPQKGQEFQKIVDRMGYANAIQTKEWMNLGHIAVTDWTSTMTGMLDTDMVKRIQKAKESGTSDVTEDEYKDAMMKGAIDNNMDPGQRQAVMAYLDSDMGQRFMANKNIKLGAAAVAHQMKEKPGSGVTLQGLLKEEDLKQTYLLLQNAKEHPGLVPESVVEAAKNRLDQHLGLAAKTAAGGQFSENNPLTPFLLQASNYRFKDPTTMMEGIDPNSKEGLKRQAILNTAITNMKAAGPDASMNAKLEAPHDMVGAPVYRMDKSGKPYRVSGNMTEREYREGAGMFTMTMDQRKQMQDLDAMEARGNELFKMADKTYKAKDKTSRALEVGAERVASADPNGLVDVLGTLVGVKQAYPGIAEYVSQRDSALGRFAKALGGEAGVLTDQDIARVKKMFNTASDTPEIRKAKYEAYKQLININRMAITSLLTSDRSYGEVSPDQLRQIAPQYRDKIEGILGSVEDRVNKNQESSVPTKPAAQSLAEPAGQSTSKPNRGQSLLEKMRSE